jgi:hypothetical protein
MKLSKPICPECHGRAVGTCDLIPGTAFFASVPKRGQNVDYAGETEMSWDGQKTITNEQGESQVTCDNWHTWFTKIT